MILEILLGALVGAAIAANWDSIVSWLSDLVTKLKRAWDGIRENIPHSARIFGDLLINGMVKIMHRLYYKKDGKFFELTQLGCSDGLRAVKGQRVGDGLA